MTTRKPRKAALFRAANEPLLPLWRAVRAAWAADAASEEGNDQTINAYRAAFAAFDKAKPTTTLGLFLTLLHSDAGDDFADEHPAAVEAILAQLQAANVSLRSLKACEVGARKKAAGKSNTRLLTAAEMQGLWENYVRARDGYNEFKPATLKAYERALDAVVKAHTIEPTGIASKLRVVAELQYGKACTQRKPRGDAVQRIVVGAIQDVDRHLRADVAALQANREGGAQ